MAKKIKVQLIRSTIGRPGKHRKVVDGLGLTRLNQVRELVDTPEVRGMINKVVHLVQVVD
ncbi:MAG: 50S ribosomal protein L30 [Magnetococcales bacterium]|nr:50S ribosomal protein L30 [Magnetococcales bacterium]